MPSSPGLDAEGGVRVVGEYLIGRPPGRHDLGLRRLVGFTAVHAQAPGEPLGQRR